MEDGQCHQMKRDNLNTALENVGRELKKIEDSIKTDNCVNINGGIDKYNQVFKKKRNSPELFYGIDNLHQSSQETSSKRVSKSKRNSNESNNIRGLNLKIPRPIITKHSTFKRVLKRSKEEVVPFPKLPKENGDHKEYKYSTPPPPQINNESALISTFHHLQNSKTKVPHKRRKMENSKQPDYAQYLGLQPAVKFKCGKCCCSSFESLGMLKEHQRFCSPRSPSACAPAPAQLPPIAAAPSTPQPSAATNTNFRITRKVYLCSACGTYYENWNLFLHIREVHNRHTCLFCFGMFSQAQKLASHLVVRHNIQEDNFASKEALLAKFPESFYLLCCKCEKVFTERENFVSHECSPVVKQCSVCKLKGGHTAECSKVSKHKKSTNLSEDGNKIKKSQVTTESYTSSPKSFQEKTPEFDNNDKQLTASTPVQEVTESDIHCENSIVEELSKDSPCVKTSDVKCNISVDNKSFISNVDNLDKNIICKDDELKPDLNIDNKHIIESDGTTSDKYERNDTMSSNSNEENVDSDMDKNIHEDSKENFTTIDDSEKDQISMDSMEQHTQNVENASSNYSEHTNAGNMVSDLPASTETLKVVSKLPPRNRRPPKRYQLKASKVENLLQVNEVKENANKVPKLTVKIPKMVVERESTSDYSSETEDSDKLTVDFDINNDLKSNEEGSINESRECNNVSASSPNNCVISEKCSKNSETSCELDIVLAGEEIPVIELSLDRPLDRYPLKDLLKVLLNATMYNCIYCYHARKVAVNGKQLAIHFIAQHRFSATVDSITAEELMPETIVLKIKASLTDVQNVFMNLEGYDSEDKSNMKYYDNTLECFQCFYVTTAHKELYLHNRKMHQKTILLCVMCKSNFYSYSELLCHLCPGTYALNSEIEFRCCLCQHDTIPSAFRLMVHLRKSHHACDVCLETCHNQSRLTNHVWKHKLHHLCYRCGIAYRNKPDITKHLFWKHGTESVLCKKCLQKRWPHVYHFCIPPNSFICEECNSTFTRAVSLKVHKRIHTDEYPYACTEPGCSDKYISKKLLKKHEMKHLEPPENIHDPPQPVVTEEKLEVIEKKPDEENAISDKLETKTTSSKGKKSKKNKKNKDRDNLLIDVNLPALNLSESDSSEESEAEASKKLEDNASVNFIDDVGMPEEPRSEPPIDGIWDNFKLYQAQVEKEAEAFEPPTLKPKDTLERQIEEPLRPNKPKHVCESDHDYCVIPTNEDDNLEETKMSIESPSKVSKHKMSKNKKKNDKKSNGSSSSDSSSDSDSSCSCGSNCSCSSSSGSSTSSSSSSDSEANSTIMVEKSPHQKDSDASAVDVLATGGTPPRLPASETVEIPIAESDLETDQTETDEDFYDEHPQRLANKILTEKRNQLMLLATVAPINNGTYLDSSRPATPENIDGSKETKKKIKTKKKKKLRKANSKKQKHILNTPIVKISPLPEEPQIAPNKITISLQTNSVIDKSSSFDSPKLNIITKISSLDSPKLSIITKKSSSLDSPKLTDTDNKRASKRRRVPNKFYGYSSDEDSMPKPQFPPKFEWRKEDLPSPSGVQQPPIPEIPTLEEILAREPKPIISPQFPLKEPIYSSDDDSESSGEGALQIINQPFVENESSDNAASLASPPPPTVSQYSRPPVGVFPFPRPAGIRQAREGESVYCYCRCPYDEVSEMIGCDGDGCAIEWFHFECVGIMVPPKGKWFCPDCRQKLENPEM